ncbi:MAG TPA: hypothetical protein VGC63_04865 [Solirubrobacterales bacterium]|jgi:hypothetical protein
MSLRSDENATLRENKKLLRRRRKAIEHKHFSLAKRLGIAARRTMQKVANIHRRRVGSFHVGMLDGHPANIDDACKRLVALAYKFAAQRGYVCTVTATTDGTHAPGSWHNPTPLGHAIDLIFATVGQMEEFQRFALEQTPGKANDFHELFGPDGFYVKEGSIVNARFPDHGDHDHIAPKDGYRR